MRRFLVIAAVFGVMLSSLGSHVAAETNPDPLQRLRFTTNVTYVNGSHPNLQVGDVLIFEIAVPQDQMVLASMTMMDPLCDGIIDCNVYEYTIAGNWQAEYRRNGEEVHSEDGTFASLVVLEGGELDGMIQPDKLWVYEDTNRLDDVFEIENGDGSWNGGGQAMSDMLSMADRDDLWDASFFLKHWGTWGTYQYDYTTADDYARVSTPAGLKFDANEGVGGPDRISGDPEEVVTVPATEPTRDDHVFVSWNTASDGSGTAYDPGDSFTLGSSTDVETLYAQWTDQVLTIVVPETSVPETTDVPTPSDVTLPATGSSGGTLNPVLFVLGLGGLLMLFARRRTPDRQQF